MKLHSGRPSPLQNLPVLVTGGSGFVGSHLASRLAAAGAEVRALVRRRGDHPGLGSPNVTQMEGDFVDPATARRACDGMALVVHGAATIGSDLAEARRVNAGGTAALAAAAREAGCRRFIHVSTISVYDWERGGSVVDETAPLKTIEKPYPHTPAAAPYYGLTKAEAERALQAEMDRGLAATILRLGAVMGVHPTSSWAVLVPAKIRQGQVSLAGGSALPWTHVENVGLAMELALTHPAASGRAYNVVDGHVPWRRYVEDVRSWFPDAPPAPGAEEPEKPAGSFVGRCSSDRIRAELGYAPLRSYEDGMAEAAAWWAKAPRKP
ncbi:MAG TPA: NAD(P)-dependent oxidoreductase [Thermoanaerobaculia bacterium]|jgi:nucleoside-diphosphate-sugar epimerase|nr:NAD(P)-dependent oxidoreductase [Thermoanaerobaculia bacterium]